MGFAPLRVLIITIIQDTCVFFMNMKKKDGEIFKKVFSK